MSDSFSGILKLTEQGFGFLHNPKDLIRFHDRGPFVPPQLVKKYRLPHGATVRGPVENKEKGPQLAAVEAIGGLAPAAFERRRPYTRLVAVDPTERFHLDACGLPAMRLVDLCAPIGRGSRGLIISPPKAGKTTLLQNIAEAIRFAHPETRIMVLLIDERPEEVTHFRRHIDAEVFASTNDRSPRDHIALVTWVLAHVQIELECGHDVVVLIDSITRISRAFNTASQSRGRIMSGGLEAGALEIPRRLFGLARNIEDGGSVTLIATALTDTGSRMDQLILEEFKGTGNTEIVLDRGLAEARIFPAIDLAAGGTRKEELLLGPERAPEVAKLRRLLATRAPRQVMDALLTLLTRHPTNAELLASIADLEPSGLG